MAQFTKIAIKKTFIDLLNEKSFDKITVQEIVSRLGINRNTFYYYYEDKYDLIKKIFEEEAQKAIDEAHICQTWKESFANSAKFALENKKAIYHIYNSVNREDLEKYLYIVVKNLIVLFIDSYDTNKKISKTNKDYLVGFYKYAIVGFILDWISRGMTEDLMVFAGPFEKLFIENIKLVLANDN